MNQNFICTKDEETAQNLIKLGFQRVLDSSETYMFLNNTTMKFSEEIDLSKISYTNKLCI